MIRKIPCHSCYYFDGGPQVCRATPHLLKKQPHEWCGQGIPHWDIDPQEARLYAGYLRTIYRQVLGLLDDNDSLSERLPRLLAWASHVSELLDEDPKKRFVQAMVDGASSPPAPKVEMTALKYVVALHSDHWEVERWWETAERFTVESLAELKTHHRVAKLAYIETKAEFDAELFFHFAPEGDRGWYSRIMLQWDSEPFEDGGEYRGVTADGEELVLYYRCEIAEDREEEPCTD